MEDDLEVKVDRTSYTFVFIITHGGHNLMMTNKSFENAAHLKYL